MVTRAHDERRLVEAVAAAVGEVPGVAFLRPGLAARLRATAASARRVNGAPTASTSGIRVRGTGSTRDADGLALEVFVVVHRGHRALDVTRAVREAVTRAARTTPAGPVPVRVTVTVSGIV
ncbi:Asp23/Gls24 family envelope stress response protein [Streptomyces sp. AN091965]|uniref:Asp23/Gls24 family envelope stress response protein n=1 Tax=Streptomyces sp. AN091965 TaxID=2927803 RepID=UPI001F6184B6|nr:Asp23/Gls24 family envelope stress response protein [Streptomyces sp. AN091965]MCI3935466.1 Asp23/Gls24 family envelope stress response protein [Streptomyces sp. AN091965]